MGFTGGIAARVNAGQHPGYPRLSKKKQAAIEIGLLFWVFAIFAVFGPHDMTDGKYSLLVSESLLRNHSFVINDRSIPQLQPFARPGYQANGYPYQMEVSRGDLLYAYPIGSSILSVPFVALMNLVGVSAQSPDGEYDAAGEQVMQGILAALLMAILTVVFFRTALLLLPLSWSIVLALGGAFSTQIWSTASRVLWSHTWEILLVGVVIYMLLSQEQRQVTGRPVLLATLLSWAYFVRPTSSIPIVAITSYLLILRPKEFTALAITGGVWMLLFVVYSWEVSGQPLPGYYLFHLSSGHLWEALAGDLISPSRGLFVYVPGSAFVLLLVGYYWQVLPHRPLAILSLIVLAVHTLVVSTDPNWWGGHCYGARLTTDLVPWLFLLAILGSRCLLEDHSSGFKHFAVAFGLLTLVIGVLMNGRGALSQSANDWVNVPEDVDQRPERVWDWSNPQFFSKSQDTDQRQSGRSDRATLKQKGAHFVFIDPPGRALGAERKESDHTHETVRHQ
jgi:hypothetical protein